ALDRPQRYDAIYSRDVFLHIHDKAKLFEVLLRALRPGGRLLFTDYCCGEKPWSEEFSRYVEDRAYSLHTLPEYDDLLRAAGFVDVASHDLTSRFREILEEELTRIRTAGIDNAIRAKLEAGWQAKLQRAGAGHQRWGLLEARRPGH
ncbi:MAG: methyltransferase domain-containing protein, partial [Arenicellales bacterium]